MKCPYCGHNWTTLKSNPKDCPKCKKTLDWERKRQQKKNKWEGW